LAKQPEVFPNRMQGRSELHKDNRLRNGLLERKGSQNIRGWKSEKTLQGKKVVLQHRRMARGGAVRPAGHREYKRMFFQNKGATGLSGAGEGAIIENSKKQRNYRTQQRNGKKKRILYCVYFVEECPSYPEKVPQPPCYAFKAALK